MAAVSVCVELMNHGHLGYSETRGDLDLMMRMVELQELGTCYRNWKVSYICCVAMRATVDARTVCWLLPIMDL